MKFVLHGWVEQASNLLRLHSELLTDPFMSLDELLRLMLVCSVTTSAADIEWRRWQVEVEVRLQEGDFAAFPSLIYVAGLLAGQGDSLTRAV